MCRCFSNEWCPGTWVEMCCLNTQQCPLPHWKVATSGCPPLGKLWELSTVSGTNFQAEELLGESKWPQSRVTVMVLPWAMGSCGHLSMCGYPPLWQRATLIGEKTTRAEKRAGSALWGNQGKAHRTEQKDSAIDPLAVHSCPVTLSLFPWLP